MFRRIQGAICSLMVALGSADSSNKTGTSLRGAESLHLLAMSSSSADDSYRCQFQVEPHTPTVWDPDCKEGKMGCKADGINVQCRFCGEDPYADCPPCGPVWNPCPVCEFTIEPTTPYVWDRMCHPEVYTKGCKADGIHFECRFCGEGDFDPCPTTTVTSTTPASTSTRTTTVTTVTTSSVAQDLTSSVSVDTDPSTTGLRSTLPESQSAANSLGPRLVAIACFARLLVS